MFSISISGAIAEAMHGLMTAMKPSPRLGPGRKTLYTVWKNVDPEHRDAAPVITWPDPLTRQCRRQLDRMARRHHDRKLRAEHRRVVAAELQAARNEGLDLPVWRLVHGMQA